MQTESFKLSEPYSQCTEDGSDVPIRNIYNAAYSLQVTVLGALSPGFMARTQETKLYLGWGVACTRNSGEDPWGSSRDLKNK